MEYQQVSFLTWEAPFGTETPVDVFVALAGDVSGPGTSAAVLVRHAEGEKVSTLAHCEVGAARPKTLQHHNQSIDRSHNVHAAASHHFQFCSCNELNQMTQMS